MDAFVARQEWYARFGTLTFYGFYNIDNMKFSVVIPIYKVEKYLRECIDSVLNQTFRDYEIILVDDGSPDSCPQICDEYAEKDDRIRVIHQKNAGLACARNTGIKAAVGEYLVCIDSDDYFLSNTALAQIDEAINDKKPDIVFYGYRKFFESDGSWGESINFQQMSGDAITITKRQLECDTYTATAWTKAIRLSLLQKHNITFTAGLISEDVDWYLQILCYAAEIKCINAPFIAYRQRPGSISHTSMVKSLTDNLWILETWTKHIKEQHFAIEKEKMLLSALAYLYANVLVLFVGFNNKDIKSYRQRIKDLSYIFDYAISYRAMIERRFIKVLGFDLTLLLLRFLNKLKKHQ